MLQQAFETNTISCLDWQEAKPVKHEGFWFRMLCLMKVDPRSNNGIFVGYDGCSPAYLVNYPDTGKVMKRRVVDYPTAAWKNTVSHNQFDDLLINPNAHPEPNVTDSGERIDVKDCGERPDVKDS